MAGRPKKIEDNKVFDISRPNKAKPLATSRPVITKISDDVTDDVVNVAVKPQAEEKTLLSAPSVSKKVIQPIKDDPKEAQDAGTTSNEEPTLSAPELPIQQEDIKDNTSTESLVKEEVGPTPELEGVETNDAVPEETTQTEASKEVVESDTKNEETESVDSEQDPKDGESEINEEEATVGAVIGQTSKKQKDGALNPEIDLAVKDLIESKKYFVPLSHDSGKKKHGIGLWAIFLVLVLLVGAYVAVDANLIGSDIELPFEIIK